MDSYVFQYNFSGDLRSSIFLQVYIEIVNLWITTNSGQSTDSITSSGSDPNCTAESQFITDSALRPKRSVSRTVQRWETRFRVGHFNILGAAGCTGGGLDIQAVMKNSFQNRPIGVQSSNGLWFFLGVVPTPKISGTNEGCTGCLAGCLLAVLRRKSL